MEASRTGTSLGVGPAGAEAVRLGGGFALIEESRNGGDLGVPLEGSKERSDMPSGAPVGATLRYGDQSAGRGHGERSGECAGLGDALALRA